MSFGVRILFADVLQIGNQEAPLSSTLSAAEVLQRNGIAMGEPLGALFTALSNELTWLFWQWHEFVQLYGTKPSRIEIMNRSAPFFFWMLQRMFWNDALLGLSRITGPESSRGQSNLTLQRLPRLIEDEKLRELVAEATGTLIQKVTFAVDWRNRHLAHRDLALALGHKGEPLKLATRDMMEDCLNRAAGILNMIELHYLTATRAYNMGPLDRGAEELLYVLRDGLRREEERQVLSGRGQYRAELFNDDVPGI